MEKNGSGHGVKRELTDSQPPADCDLQHEGLSTGTEGDDDPCHTKLHNPVDTGWSWVIMISVFFIQLVSMGIMRSFGVLFVEMELKFQTSASTIAVVGGVEAAAFSITAVFCMSILLEVTSVRCTTVIGGIIGMVGLVISFLAPTIFFLFFSFSVCLGVGMGLSMAPGYVLLTIYFTKKRSLAMAMANTGSSIGSVTMPMVTRMLLDTYFLSGTLLLLGGVFAQVIVFGALFTPPSDYGRRKCLQLGDGKSEDDSETKYESQRRLLVKESNEAQRELNNVPERCADKGLPRRYLDICTMEPLTKSLPSVTVTPSKKTNSLLSVNGQPMHQSYPIPTEKNYGSWKDIFSMDKLVIAASMGSSQAISLNSLGTDARRNVYLRKDTSDKTADTLKHTDDNVDSKEKNDECTSVLHVLKTFRICDSSMYQSVVFWLLAVYHFAACLVCSLPAAYLPALALEKGLTPTQGALLLTICGALDIVSRLVPGLLAQSSLVKPQTSVAVSLFVLGITFQLTAVVEGMVAMVMMSVVYGLFSGVFFSMMQLVILDFSDVSKFRQLFSVTQLALGASGITGFPIVGFLRDMSNSYVISFHFMGACGFLASVILFVMPTVYRREMAKATQAAAVYSVSCADEHCVVVTDGTNCSG